MGPTINQPKDKAKGIHGCGANRLAIMHVSHGLCTTVTPENSPLPYKMFADHFEHHVARHGP